LVAIRRVEGRIYMLKLCSIFVVIFLITLNWHGVVADDCITGCNSEYGIVLGEYSGVTAYSNCKSTCVSGQSNYVGDRYTGMPWQCVEYARRYWLVAQGIYVSTLCDAHEIWDNWTSGERISDGSNVTTQKFENGGTTSPREGDLLIYKDTYYDDYGHVAVITEVNATEGYVRVAEQNHDNVDWEQGTDYARELDYMASGGNYTITESSDDIYGWLRNPEYTGTFEASWSLQTPTYPDGLEYYPAIPGQIIPVEFIFDNTGSAYWTGANDPGSEHYVELHSVTSSWDADSPSVLSYNWIDGSDYKITTSSGNIDPDNQGHYSFEIQVPTEPGDYDLYVSLYRPHTAEYISGLGPTLHIRVNSQPLSDFLWVPCFSEDAVYKVNVVTHETESTIPVSDGPGGIAVGHEYVYVTHRYDASLARISKITDEVHDYVDLSSYMAFCIAVAVDKDENVYVVGRQDIGVYHYDLAILVKLDENGFLVGQKNVADIAGYGDSSGFWNIGLAVNKEGTQAILPWNRPNDNGTGIIIVDTETPLTSSNTVLNRDYGYLGPGAIFDESGRAWVCAEREAVNSLYRYTPGEGLYRKTFSSPNDGRYYGLTLDNDDKIWAGTNYRGYDNIGRLITSNSDKDQFNTIDIGGAIGGMAVDAYGYIWIVKPFDNTLVKYDSEGSQVGDIVTVGEYPLGLGDMTGYECPGAWDPIVIEGDANGDGSVNIADASFIINAIFFGGTQPDPIESADANCDGSMNIADASYIINWIFFGGDPPCGG